MNFVSRRSRLADYSSVNSEKKIGVHDYPEYLNFKLKLRERKNCKTCKNTQNKSLDGCYLHFGEHCKENLCGEIGQRFEERVR